MLLKVFHQWKSHISLLVSGYALAASRMLSVFAMRLIADPLTVGIINLIQTVINITTTLSLGSVYATMRSLPMMSDEDKARSASSSFIAILIEGLVIGVIAVAVIALITYYQHALHVSILLFVFAFSIGCRAFVYFESLLQALAHFKLISQLRFIRIFEPVIALIGIYFLGINGFLGFSIVFAGFVLLLSWKKLGERFYITKEIIISAIKSIRQPSSYGMWVAAERFVMGLSSIADALLVTLVLGPVALSGYYLGVNIRGLLQQVASTFIFHRWAHAVHTYEKAGEDIFTNKTFLMKYLLLSSVLLMGTFLALFLALEWILPSYKLHYVECMWAAAVAIPFSFTGFLRVSQLLAMKGKQLLILSLGRLIMLGSAYGFLILNNITVSAPIIGMLAYGTAVAEFSINYFIVNKVSFRTMIVWISIWIMPILIINLFEMLG